MATTYYRRPDILAHPGFEKGHAVIEASAGTGKTYTLEHLVLDLLIHNRADIEQILVVTFTDAATRELRERVRTLIRKVCHEGTPVKPTQDSKHYWEIDDATRTRLQEALFRFDGAAIYTIHGFCQRILSEQAFLGGHLFRQEHVDGREVFGLAFREEVRRALAEESAAGEALRLWLEEENSLSDLQDLLYNCHREGCPGRSRLTPQWDPPGFWAAAKGLPRQDELLGRIETFFTNPHQKNGYKRLINRFFEELSPALAGAEQDREPNFREAVALLQEWTGKKCSINKIRDTQGNHIQQAAAMKDAPDVFKTLARTLNEMAQRAASTSSFFVYCLLPRVQKRLRARKLSLGLIDYDDMLLGVREALSGENARLLLTVLRQRWKYALVDEFQDTDPIQWEIFRRIFVEGEDNHHLYIIGDPKQAIYDFRGADVHTYRIAREHLLKEYRASRMPLDKNYRSTEKMIAAVNTILTATGKDGNGFFSGLNRYDEPVQWGKLTGPAFAGGKPVAPVHLVHLYGEGEPLNAASIRKGLAHFIAREIARLRHPQAGLIVGGKNGKSLKLSDIYILTRTAREGQQIGEVLRRHGIHHAFYKLEGLFQTAEAEDVYRLLKAIESPHDPAGRMAAWLTPFFEVPLKELMNWQEVGEAHPLVACLRHWKRLAVGREWARLFDDILTTSGLIRRLIFYEAERELTNYLHLFELLLTEAHTRPITLPELARGLKALIDGRKLPAGREGDMQRLETDQEAVQILTMHKAKGLEAEVIFVAGGFTNPRTGALDTQIYHQKNRRCLHIGPADGAIAAAIEKEIEEENQRLAYVAMTRACSRLYLPYFGDAPAGEEAEGRSYGFNKLGKFYRALQQQLDRLRRQGHLDNRHFFQLRPVSVAARYRQSGKKAPSRPDNWPPEKLLAPLPSFAGQAKQIKPSRRGIILTSYTRMSRGQGWQPPLREEDGATDWRSEEVAAEVGTITDGLALPHETPTENRLIIPPGRESGIFLHALLEEAALEDLSVSTFEQWSSRPALQNRAAACARQHGLSEEYLPAALAMVYRALRTPLQVENREGGFMLKMPGGIAAGKHPQAEMSFVYPIPENFHPLLKADRGTPPAAADDLPFRAHRGYIRGLIDLVFEHAGKIYLLDWKSDLLPAFDEVSLNAHVEANYRLQALIYRLAVLRLLGIMTEEKYEELFGGVLYLFIRGLEPAGDEGRLSRGAWFSRPPWPRVLDEEETLVNCRKWGGEVIT